MKRLRVSIAGFIILFLSIYVVSCHILPMDNRQPTPSDTPPFQQTPAKTDSDQVRNEANIIIDNIEVLLLESFPVQVKVIITGSFSNGCTQIKDVVINRKENVFEINISTERTGEICTEVLTPFSQTIDLDINGLKAGKYIIKMGNKTAEFELTVDNVLSDNTGSSDDEQIEPVTPLEGETVYIDRVMVDISSSHKIRIQIQGNLPDGCTKIKKITHQIQPDNIVVILILTERPAKVMCTEALVPFDEIYELDAKDLPAGTYHLIVYDQNVTFTIE